MGVSLTSLVAQVRQITDRVNDPTLLDATIIGYLSDAARSLYDIFLDSSPHWVQSRFDFTLVGNSDATSVVALPDDFQVDLGLDWLNPPSVVGPLTVRRLPTFLDRNRLNPYNTLALSPAFYNRNYEVQGSELRMYPALNCAGDYRLFYQVQLPEFLPEQTLTWDIGDSATVPNHYRIVTVDLANDSVVSATKTWHFENGDFGADDADIQINVSLNLAHGGTLSGLFTIQTIVDATTVITYEDPAVTDTFLTGSSVTVLDSFWFAFPNAAFTQDMVGGELIVNFTNIADAGLNGTYTIYAVMSPTAVVIRIYGPTLTTHNPTAGTVTVNWQPPNTTPELSQVFAPWQIYIKTFAAISVMTSFQENVDTLNARLASETARAKRMSERRESDIRQIPILNGRPGIDSPNFDSGGGWGWDP